MNTVPSISPQDQALERFKPLLPADEFEVLLQELEKPLYPAIRVNPLKTNPAAAIQRWVSAYDWQVRPVPFCETGWWVTQAPEGISQPVEHRLGSYYIQDAASMLPVSLFDFNKDERPLILDMAASPGGKTTHLIDRSRDTGLVVANDSSRERITTLRLVLQNWGAINVAVTRFPGEQYGLWFPETFDKVLLDAPCSMQNLRSTEARPMHAISAKERQMLSIRQERLLVSALQAARVGGQVVYATCTLNPEEDEAVLDAVLRQFDGAFKVEDLSRRMSAPAPALTSAMIGGVEKTFSREVRNAARLWPHIFGTSGFFSALIRKLTPLPAKQQPPPQFSAAKSDLKPMNAKETRLMLDQLLQAYGFDFSPVLSAQLLSLWRRADVCYAIPDAWWSTFGRFPFQAVGMRIAEESQMLVPSHEWVARFGNQFEAGCCIIPLSQAAAWLRGEDLALEACSGIPKGTIVAVKDEEGRLYGRGKISANRLRNLLPTRAVYY